MPCWDGEIHDTVIQHPIGSATVGDIFLELPREAFEEMEQKLANKAIRERDNHTVYEVVHDSEITYIWCTNSTVFFGRTINLIC